MLGHNHENRANDEAHYKDEQLPILDNSKSGADMVCNAVDHLTQQRQMKNAHVQHECLAYTCGLHTNWTAHLLDVFCWATMNKRIETPCNNDGANLPAFSVQLER